ncbi:MAG TPA: S8 family serine peptidase [Candidatus Saccharimonadia bacterium]|nr:S8 family serine peptidase [Candidatus Saccharimonadia bacterium]
MSVLRRPLTAAIVTALGFAAFDASAARLDPRLESKLASATPTSSFEVIVTFPGEGAPTAAQLDRLEGLGIGGVTLRSLPIAGVVATPAQIRALASDDAIRSVWWNAPLTYENEQATQISGVDRLRNDTTTRTTTGLPYTGRGVGVLVNDSGIDGIHKDLQFGPHVVQNVAAQVNLHAQETFLPVTYQENVPNTDWFVGHGSHVAGIVGGTGAAGSTAGRFEGVAPGADLIGYGSGAGLFILDTLGGFDYALSNQAQYGIRIVTNSFGTRSDTCTAFNPDDPTNVATKALADRNMIVVFSAGNSGSGECTITGNYKKAPWVVTVASGDKQGHLNNFSSRGALLAPGGSVEIDGESYDWIDRPTITAPGSGIYSTRASTNDPAGVPSEEEINEIGPNNAVYYTKLSGTSMSAPHAAGVIALMLEANPQLTWREVKQILEETATNIPGEPSWEAGGGYINAHAAVRAALGKRQYAETVNAHRTFNANADVAVRNERVVPVSFTPAGTPTDYSFTVGEGVALVSAGANVSSNTVAISLTDPTGRRYGSAIALPVLGPAIGVTAPGMPGTWKLAVRGIGAVSGVDVDPVNATNGYAAPGTVNVRLKEVHVIGYTGLDDVVGHPAQGFIQYGVFNRLVDAGSDGLFRPDAPLTRAELSQYLVSGAGIRQATATPLIPDVDFANPLYGYAAAVMSRGGALRDIRGVQSPVMFSSSGALDGSRVVRRQELAYSLVQSLALQTEATAHTGDVTAIYNGTRIKLEDQAQIAPSWRGYVQYALDLGLLQARFELVPGGFAQPPRLAAYVDPIGTVSRADYAASATRYLSAVGVAAE